MLTKDVMLIHTTRYVVRIDESSGTVDIPIGKPAKYTSSSTVVVERRSENALFKLASVCSWNVENVCGARRNPGDESLGS